MFRDPFLQVSPYLHVQGVLKKIRNSIRGKRIWGGLPIGLKISSAADRRPSFLEFSDPRMDIFRYRKMFIYILTFMAYAWSGYGAGLLSNLRDAVLSAETFFGDFFQNAITVARKIKDIHEVFDAAVEEACVYKCPTGKYTEKKSWKNWPLFPFFNISTTISWQKYDFF